MLAMHQFSRITVLFFILTSLTGCVNLNAVGEFAKGAQMLSDASGEFYNKRLETDRKLASQTIDLDDPQDTWLEATKGQDLIDESRRNQAAVASLAQYAKSLNEIATFDDDENIEKASKELGNNLNSIADSVSDDSILATAIEGLAKAYFNVKKRSIIHKAVIKAQPDVEIIVNTLESDITNQKQRILVTRIAASARRETRYNKLINGYSESSEGEQVFRSIAAGNLVSEELNNKLNIQPDQAFLDQLKKTTESCLIAHESIQVQGPDENDPSLVEFVNNAKFLQSVFD